jgi:hypothetical protein
MSTKLNIGLAIAASLLAAGDASASIITTTVNSGYETNYTASIAGAGFNISQTSSLGQKVTLNTTRHLYATNIPGTVTTSITYLTDTDTFLTGSTGLRFTSGGFLAAGTTISASSTFGAGPELAFGITPSDYVIIDGAISYNYTTVYYPCWAA